MQRLITSLLILSIAVGYPVKAVADCDFSTGITKEDKGYLYSPECNKKVGKLVQDAKDRDDQVNQLNKTVQLKDLAVQDQEKRANMWMDSSLKLQDKVNEINKMESTNKWLYFGLGVVVFGAAVWGAGQLRR